MSDEVAELMNLAFDREFDAEVAERVHGWTNTGSDRLDLYLIGTPPERDLATAVPCGHYDYLVPSYSNDAADDYKTLDLVRRTWDGDKLVAYLRMLNWILVKRDNSGDGTAGLKLLVSYYQPGDWSRAALAALGDKP